MVSSDVCKRCYVCDDFIVNDVNLSDHDPICFSLSLLFNHPVLLSGTNDIADFQSTMHDCVKKLRYNAACGCLCCGAARSEAKHLRDIDLLADHAHRLLDDSAFRRIPHSRSGDHAAVIPG